MLGKENNEQATAQPAPDNPPPHYLQESVRLAELLIEGQIKTFYGLDRKAVWLVTICIATIGYLLSLDAARLLAFITAVVFVILAVATWKGAKVIFLAEIWSPGAAPEYTSHAPFGGDFTAMAEELLKDYQNAFNANKETLGKKIKQLENALWWARCGIFGALVIALITLSNPVYAWVAGIANS